MLSYKVRSTCQIRQDNSHVLIIDDGNIVNKCWWCCNMFVWLSVYLKLSNYVSTVTSYNMSGKISLMKHINALITFIDIFNALITFIDIFYIRSVHSEKTMVSNNSCTERYANI